MAGYWDRIFLLAFVIHPMSGFEIYAKSEMIVENGTDVRLSCTFKSNQVDQRTLSVYWSFKPGTGGKDQLILYYLAGQSKSQFPDRIAWDGNINKSDVSIIIKNIDFKDNGTYTCQVINPFDYSKTAAEILLSVVEQGSLPKHSIITGAVIGAVVGLLLIIGVVYFIKRKKDGQRNAYISSVENVFPTEQPLRNSAVSGVKDSMNHRSVGPFQGPVIYAQLDHSGQRHSNKIYKSDSVVYSDIQRC
ncbi:myelin protein zero-like 1 like isoform X1 [Chiloscyllium plagiosum]|uniref:myelin protein zero-like 1 like isoform X1 n=2 Tax=Chiloscyllium plagiosum TaxID=36176 RepID=UPI001CB804FE|nr:myelin protein zero-like 1 like isoform X1 [Chiloscyllium plagiosum]